MRKHDILEIRRRVQLPDSEIQEIRLEQDPCGSSGLSEEKSDTGNQEKAGKKLT